MNEGEFKHPWSNRLGGDVPSMDDKDTPSPPVLTTEEYEMYKAQGIVRGGHPVYFIGGVVEE